MRVYIALKQAPDECWIGSAEVFRI